MNQTITKEEYERLLACAVEVQALREALTIAANALQRNLTDWLERKWAGETATAALSAPSESERVLAARDERTRADALDMAADRICDEYPPDVWTPDSDFTCRDIADLVRSLAATPPSAASAPDCTLTVEDAVGTGNPCAASGKGAT